VTTQSERATPEILIQLPEAELTGRSHERLAPYRDNGLVSPETLRANEGVFLDAQLQVAERLADDPRRWQAAMDWRGLPTIPQVRELGYLPDGLVPTSGAVKP
jgi:hypothetical protein